MIEWSWMVGARARNRVDAVLGRTEASWSAQSTVEYALVGALVVIVAAGALSALGGEVNTIFTNITNALKGTAAGH